MAKRHKYNPPPILDLGPKTAATSVPAAASSAKKHAKTETKTSGVSHSAAIRRADFATGSIRAAQYLNSGIFP
jgi:hypothetical protein